MAKRKLLLCAAFLMLESEFVEVKKRCRHVWTREFTGNRMLRHSTHEERAWERNVANTNRQMTCYTRLAIFLQNCIASVWSHNKNLQFFDTTQIGVAWQCYRHRFVSQRDCKTNRRNKSARVTATLDIDNNWDFKKLEIKHQEIILRNLKFLDITTFL
jgi:hypothetical protein